MSDTETMHLFGIVDSDELGHPHSPDEEWWNESWFWDWFSPGADTAGHLRFGIHPNQDRAWLWLLLYDSGEWLVVEEPRLPRTSIESTDRHVGYEGWGLSFRWTPDAPLRGGRLEAEGYGRVVTGGRAGMVLPVAVDLEIACVGPPHSTGQHDVDGHGTSGISASRFEQAISAHGTQQIGATVHRVDGHGERDHSWGPRPWDMEWLFCAATFGDGSRLQWAAVDIPGLDRIHTGYLMPAGRPEATESVTEVAESIELSAGLADPANGPFRVTTDAGTEVRAALTSVSGVEIDIAHCFSPPRPTKYRRVLVRIEPDDRPHALGWLEFNRFDPARAPA